MEQTVEPLLPMDLEVLDAKALYDSRSDNETIHIKFYNGKYRVESRVHDLGGVDWTYHFNVSRAVAQKIVAKGYATWWHTVDESIR